MLFNKAFERDFETMVQEAIGRLKDNTDIKDFSAGSIARALVEVYYDDMEHLHKKLSYSVAMSFVSSAKGPYLDEIAKLFDMERYNGESDENFRYRIIHATESLAQANKISIKLSCLSVDGVYDVVMKRFARGAGSFDIYIITEDPEVSEDIIQNVRSEIEDTEAFGIDGQILQPEHISIDMNLVLVFYDEVSREEKSSIKSEVEQKITQYLTNISMGDDLIITQLIDLVMDINQNAIKDMEITNMTIDGKQVIIDNKQFYWDQRLIPGNIIIK